MRQGVILLLAALLATLAWTGSAGAQEEIEVRASRARSDFPSGIVFILDAASSAGFDDVRLVYRVAPDGVRATAIPDCAGGTVVSCTFELISNERSRLIPGAEVTYFWRLTVGDTTEETEPQLLIYEDERFDWRTVSEGNLTLWWYRGSEDEARRVLAAGRESLDAISALLQTAVDFPVKIRYYGSAEEMRPAIISTERQGVVTLGEVVYSDTAMVSADFAPTETARHEIAHIVIRQAVRGPFGVPDWLHEGTAVFAQSQPSPNQREALARAVQSGQLLSVRSLSSASSGAQPERVALFYGQSYSLVAFLVESYGEEQFARLFQTFKEGATTAEALEQVYGFNQDGLENAWRESIGLPPRQAPTPDEERAAPTQPIATPETASAPGSGDDGGAQIIVIIAIAGLAVLLAGGLLGAAVIVGRRWR